MADRASVLVTALVVVAVVAITASGVSDVQDTEQQAIEYCNDEHENATAVWKNEGELIVVHCELENGTVVDVPDDVFS